MCSGDSDFRQWPETVFPDLTAPQPVKDASDVIVLRGAVSVLFVDMDMLTSSGDRVVHQCRSSRPDCHLGIVAVGLRGFKVEEKLQAPHVETS